MVHRFKVRQVIGEIDDNDTDSNAFCVYMCMGISFICGARTAVYDCAEKDIWVYERVRVVHCEQPVDFADVGLGDPTAPKTAKPHKHAQHSGLSFSRLQPAKRTYIPRFLPGDRHPFTPEPKHRR